MKYTKDDYKQMAKDETIGWFWNNDNVPKFGVLRHYYTDSGVPFERHPHDYYENFRSATKEEVLEHVWIGD